jgi:hypothetical protein
VAESFPLCSPRILATGLAVYFAIRYGASSVYGEGGSAIILNIVGLVLIVLGTPVAFAIGLRRIRCVRAVP